MRRAATAVAAAPLTALLLLAVLAFAGLGHALVVEESAPADGASVEPQNALQIDIIFDEPIARDAVAFITAVSDTSGYRCGIETCGAVFLGMGGRKLTWAPHKDGHFVQSGTEVHLELGRGTTDRLWAAASPDNTLEPRTLRWSVWELRYQPIVLVDHFPRDGDVVTPEEAEHGIRFTFNKAVSLDSFRYAMAEVAQARCPLTVCGTLSARAGGREVIWTPTTHDDRFQQGGVDYVLRLGQAPSAWRLQAEEGDQFLERTTISFSIRPYVNHAAPLALTDADPDDGGVLGEEHGGRLAFRFSDGLSEAAARSVRLSYRDAAGATKECTLAAEGSACGAWELREGKAKLSWTLPRYPHELNWPGRSYTVTFPKGMRSSDGHKALGAEEQVTFTVEDRTRLELVKSFPADGAIVSAAQASRIWVRFSKPLAAFSERNIRVSYRNRQCELHVCGTASLSSDGTVLSWEPHTDAGDEWRVEGRHYELLLGGPGEGVHVTGALGADLAPTRVRWQVQASGGAFRLESSFPADGAWATLAELRERGFELRFSKAVDAAAAKANVDVVEDVSRVCSLRVCGVPEVRGGGRVLAWRPRGDEATFDFRPGHHYAIHVGREPEAERVRSTYGDELPFHVVRFYVPAAGESKPEAAAAGAQGGRVKLRFPGLAVHAMTGALKQKLQAAIAALLELNDADVDTLTLSTLTENGNPRDPADGVTVELGIKDTAQLFEVQSAEDVQQVIATNAQFVSAQMRVSAASAPRVSVVGPTKNDDGGSSGGGTDGGGGGGSGSGTGGSGTDSGGDDDGGSSFPIAAIAGAVAGVALVALVVAVVVAKKRSGGSMSRNESARRLNANETVDVMDNPLTDYS